MTYLWLNLAVLGLVLLGTGALLALRARRRRHGQPATPLRPWLLAGAVALVVLVALTAVFDSVIIAVGLVDYDPALISGVRIGAAPIEDFFYPLAGVILLPAVWLLLGPRAGGRDRRETLRILLLTSRPLSWINTAFPFAAAWILATGRLDLTFVVGTLYFLIPYNLMMYGINDVYDYESDLRNPRKGGVEGALLPLRLHALVLRLSWLLSLPFLAFLLVVGSPASAAALAVSVVAVVAYSQRGLRFKERPVLDSITSSTHFVSPAVVGLALAGAEFSPAILCLLAAFFLWGMASHAFGAVQDVIPDREAGIASIATAFGARATVRLSVVAWLLAGLLLLPTDWPGPLAGLAVLPYAASAAVFWNVDDERSGEANRGWRRFLVLNFLAGFAVTLTMIGWSLGR